VKTSIKYLGWSNIIIPSPNGSLAFDPFYRPMYGADWATLEDFKDVKVICISHGHHEHYLDTPNVVKLTNAKVVSSKEVCDHLHSKYNVPKENLVPVRPHEEVTVEGFKITAFSWYHRPINYLNFFKGNLVTGLTFTLTNLLKAPYDAPYYGFFVETSDGFRALNFTEGLNPLFPTGEMKELAKKFNPCVLIGGAQLHYEEDVARAVKAISPETFIMYHPHEKLFGSMKLKSSTPETFIKHAKNAVPKVKIIYPEPMASVTLDFDQEK